MFGIHHLESEKGNQSFSPKKHLLGNIPPNAPTLQACPCAVVAPTQLAAKLENWKFWEAQLV
jgi:hypothetical protein